MTFFRCVLLVLTIPGHHRCRRVDLRHCPAQPVDAGPADSTKEKHWIRQSDLDEAQGKQGVKTRWDCGTVHKGQGIGTSNHAQSNGALNVQVSQMVMHKCVSIPCVMSLPVLWANGYSE